MAKVHWSRAPHACHNSCDILFPCLSTCWAALSIALPNPPLTHPQAKDVEESERRERQQQLKRAHAARVEAWRNRSKGNVRSLLGSLQDVLWVGSGWAPLGVGDLLEPQQVRV